LGYEVHLPDKPVSQTSLPPGQAMIDKDTDDLTFKFATNKLAPDSSHDTSTTVDLAPADHPWDFIQPLAAPDFFF
jgi:hypothetical protein